MNVGSDPPTAVRESLGEQDITTPPEYFFLPPPGQRSLIAGIEVRPHVQAFADAARKATRVQSIGTYIGHDPSADLALDLFHAIGDDELADAICWFAVKALNRGDGLDYIISRQRIFNPEILNEWRWMADRNSPTQNHMDHVHISFEATAPKPPAPEPKPEPKGDQRMLTFRYIFDGLDWVFDGPSGLFFQCDDTAQITEVLDPLKVPALGKVSPSTHRRYSDLAKSAGFSG